MTGLRSTARVDLDAIRANTALLAERAGSAAVMAMVKADGYGHGLLPSARAALAGGAEWIGVAFLEEALTLRHAGIDAPTLVWLIAPGEDLAPAVRENVDIGVSARWALDATVLAARSAGRVARVHLEVDTGLARGGARPDADWLDLVEAAAKAQADGTVEIVGVSSHLVEDDPRHPTTDRQLTAFHSALQVAERHGIEPEIRHLAKSTATLWRPDTHFDVVRPGIALYGLSPAPHITSSRAAGLRPAMTLLTSVALTKHVPAGQGVSYGHHYTTTSETTLALVPLGYGDGIPRQATNAAPVGIAGRRYRVSGVVCMDQFVVDVGDDDVQIGDEVVLFGPGERGEPTADDWAAAIGSINYEIVTRVGTRVPRTYVGSEA